MDQLEELLVIIAVRVVREGVIGIGDRELPQKMKVREIVAEPKGAMRDVPVIHGT